MVLRRALVLARLLQLVMKDSLLKKMWPPERSTLALLWTWGASLLLEVNELSGCLRADGAAKLLHGGGMVGRFGPGEVRPGGGYQQGRVSI